MSFFYVKFFITNILFSLVIAAGFVQFSQKGTGRKNSVFELTLYALGVGPVLTVTLLYYLLLVFPQKRSVFLHHRYFRYLPCPDNIVQERFRLHMESVY